MHRVLLATFALSTLFACDKTDEPAVADSGTELELGDITSGTKADDWWPIVKGNLPNTISDDACNDPTGPVCFDCFHAGLLVYARWIVDKSGRTYSTVMVTYDAVNDIVYAAAGVEVETSGGIPSVFTVEPDTLCVPAWLALGE